VSKLLIVTIVVSCVFSAMMLGRALLLWFNPDIHCLPAISRCRLCGHRIWAWQSYERRNYKVTTDNPEHLPMIVEMTGLVHCDCKGTPETKAKVTTKGVAIPELGTKETMAVSVPTTVPVPGMGNVEL